MGNKLNRPLPPVHPPDLHIAQAPNPAHYIWLWIALAGAAIAFALITFYMYCMDTDDREDRSGMLAFPRADWHPPSRRKDNTYDESPRKDKDEDLEKATREDEEYTNPDVLIGNAKMLLKSAQDNKESPMSFGVGSYIPTQTSMQLADEKDRKLWLERDPIRQTSVDVHEEEGDNDKDRKDSVFHSYDIFAKRRPRRLSQDSGTGDVETDGGGDILDESPSKDVEMPEKLGALEKRGMLASPEEDMDVDELREIPELVNPRTFHGYLHLARGYSVISSDGGEDR